MKRTLAAIILCICLVTGGALLGSRPIMPASAGLEPAELPVVILDAGHGGEDGGAVSAGGAKESEINLAIVRRLEAMLLFLGIEPVLTRREEVSLHDQGCQTLREKKASDLKNRTAMVNDIPNAMLISIHQNYFTDPRYSGAQVFFTQGDVSRQWGDNTQQALWKMLGQENLRQAMGLTRSVYLFEHISCPALLVECGFLSNAEEASLLLTDGYQRRIAIAVAGAYYHELQMLRYVGGS